jgi:regulator of sigma E protease
VILTIRRADGTETTVPISLRDAAHAATEGAMGVIINATSAGPPIQVGPLEAVGMGVQRSVSTVTQVLGALGSFISDIGHPQVTGPIGIARAVGQTRSQDAAPWSLLYLVALLSANLAILNVLPIPPMDGGRIATSLLRAVGRGRVGIRFERRAALVGFMLLIALVFWIGANDIGRPQG